MGEGEAFDGEVIISKGVVGLVLVSWEEGGYVSKERVGKGGVS